MYSYCKKITCNNRLDKNLRLRMNAAICHRQNIWTRRVKNFTEANIESRILIHPLYGVHDDLPHHPSDHGALVPHHASQTQLACQWGPQTLFHMMPGGSKLPLIQLSLQKARVFVFLFINFNWGSSQKDCILSAIAGNKLADWSDS